MIKEELILWGPAFVPQAIPEDVQVRCGWCQMIDHTRKGHNLKDCNLALREEVQVLRAQIEGNPVQRSWS